MRLLLLAATLSAAEFLPIPPGEQMVKDSATGFQVKIQTGAYLLGSTEVTQQQYTDVMKSNPSHYKGPNPVSYTHLTLPTNREV